MSDIYAAFHNTSLRYRINYNEEIFVKGKGWVKWSDVVVGDQVVFGKVSCIGTIEDLNNRMILCQPEHM